MDVRGGLGTARAAGVDYVVLTSAGVDPLQAPELAGFFSQLSREARLVRAFAPEPGRAAGPLLRVYRLKRGRA